MISSIIIKDKTILNHLTVLRSVAVILVLLFHFDKELLISGYIGVDIFFAISGYLIAMISFKRVDDLSSLKQFYIKRIMRIYPVLLFVSFSVIFLLSLIEYLEYESLAMIRDTLLGSSNFKAEQMNANYFHDNNNNYMLHLWSIAIELQFYLIFPIFMLFKKIKNHLLFIIIGIEILSLVFLAMEISYYDSLGRVFSFSTGILAYLLRDKVSANNYIYFISLACLIFLSSINLDVITYPNYYNIPIALLTLTALIYGNIEDKRRYQLFIFIGLISYSLYLWHYPLFLFFTHAKFDINVFNIFVLLSTLLALSLFSYYAIEKRFIPKNYGNYTLLLIVTPLLLTVFIIYNKKTQALDIKTINAVYEKITLNPLLYNSQKANTTVSNKYKGCLDNKDELLTDCSSAKINNSTKTALVIGNSFVHSGGLVFLDNITAHYNIKSDFYYRIRNKNIEKKVYDKILARDYDYLFIYYPWLKISKDKLIKRYKGISQYTQIIFVQGTHYNEKINKKQIFRFNNLFSSNEPFKCFIQEPYSTISPYAIVDSSLEELNAKTINIHELQKDKNSNYICSYKNIALYTDNFHINNYAGELFAKWFIEQNKGGKIFTLGKDSFEN